MDLIFNELSFFPLADNGHITEERFKTVIRTFGDANKKYDFTHIRFPWNYASQKVTETLNLYEWISTIQNRTLKTLILTLFRKPYTDDLEEAELDRFFECNYKVKSENAPKRDSPVGLPVSNLKSVPCISFNSDIFWNNRKIEILKLEENEIIDTFQTYNICLSRDLESKEFNEWGENVFPEFLNSIELLKKYLGFSRFKLLFSDDFIQQFFNWKLEDMNTFKYLLLLIKDVELHPFTGGRGQTENLKNRGKEASKRINLTDRLSYKIEQDTVTFISCKGHYEFHD